MRLYHFNPTLVRFEQENNAQIIAKPNVHFNPTLVRFELTLILGSIIGIIIFQSYLSPI